MNSDFFESNNNNYMQQPVNPKLESIMGHNLIVKNTTRTEKLARNFFRKELH